MKKLRFLEFMTVFFMLGLGSLLVYSYVMGYGTISTSSGGTTTSVTNTTTCGSAQIISPTAEVVSGSMNVVACAPGSLGAVYYLVYLYPTGPSVVKYVVGPAADSSGKINFPAFNTREVPDGSYSLKVSTGTSGITLVKNIWVSNGTITGTPGSGTTTSGGSSTAAGTNTAVPPTVATDISNLATNGGQSASTIQDFVNKQITAEQEKKLPEDLKKAPISIVLVAEKADVKMKDEKSGRVKLSGKAEPNTTIYLYIFSDPIVASVKADAQGNWEYELDKELAAGQHEVYVAVKADDGTIKAKSLPFTFFVGSAAAAAQSATPAPASTASQNYLLYYVILAVAIVALLISALFYLITKKHLRKHEVASQA